MPSVEKKDKFAFLENFDDQRDEYLNPQNFIHKLKPLITKSHKGMRHQMTTLQKKLEGGYKITAAEAIKIINSVILIK